MSRCPRCGENDCCGGAYEEECAELVMRMERYEKALLTIELSTSTFGGDNFPAEARDAANSLARAALAPTTAAES